MKHVKEISKIHTDTVQGEIFLSALALRNVPYPPLVDLYTLDIVFDFSS